MIILIQIILIENKNLIAREHIFASLRVRVHIYIGNRWGRTARVENTQDAQPACVLTRSARRIRAHTTSGIPGCLRPARDLARPARRILAHTTCAMPMRGRARTKPEREKLIDWLKFYYAKVYQGRMAKINTYNTYNGTMVIYDSKLYIVMVKNTLE